MFSFINVFSFCSRVAVFRELKIGGLTDGLNEMENNGIEINTPSGFPLRLQKQ